MRPPRFALAALLALLVVTLGAVPGSAKDDDMNFVQKFLEWVEVGEPIVTSKITLYPLVSPRPLTDPGVDAVTSIEGVTFSEPEFPRSRYDIAAKNDRDRPTLVIGGIVLEGGKRDRLVRQSTILAPHAEAEISTYPAATTSDIRKEPVPFKIAESLAPLYLRQKAEFGGSANTVMTFIARWLDFREDGDERRSLVAIASSEKLKQFCLPCYQAAANILKTENKAPYLVGGVGVIHGRIQGVFLYGNDALVKACFPAMLKGATYPAAALELRAEKAGIPLPATGDDPEATQEIITKEVKDLLANLGKATFRKDKIDGEGQIGEALLIRTSDGTRGRAIALNGRLIQLALYPHDPFSSALYGAALDVPDEDEMSDPEREGIAELDRRSRQRGQRLTEAEQRLLDRLRRGGAAGPAPGMNPPGPLGPGIRRR